MLETLKNSWKNPRLRKKLIYSVVMLMFIRVGSGLLLPFLNAEGVRDLISGQSENPFDTLNMITGGSLGYTVVLALGVTPYINATIILQLLGVVFPNSLGSMMREGESGKQKYERITRFTTLGLALIQGIAYFFYIKREGFLKPDLSTGYVWFTGITLVLILVAGALVTMWIGEQMTQKGIGNGISLIIFSGILSQMPSMFYGLWTSFTAALATGATRQIIGAPILFILYFLMVIFVVYITQAERRIPIEYSQRQVGRKMYGGQKSYLPFKVNMSGVIPVIFASSFLSIPTMIRYFVNLNPEGLFYKILAAFDPNTVLYAVLYFLLIFVFNYFYTTVVTNPMEIANSLRKSNASIRGIRPGKPTADYISKVVSKITVMGGLFLGVVAVTPTIVGLITGLNFSMAGTSIIILVGVAIETVKSLESQMTMRSSKGFLE